MDLGECLADASSPTEVLHSHNSLAPQRPYRIPLKSSQGSPTLYPGDSIEFPVVLHAERLGEQELCLLFVYREVCILHFFFLSILYSLDVRRRQRHSILLAWDDITKFDRFSTSR